MVYAFIFSHALCIYGGSSTGPALYSCTAILNQFRGHTLVTSGWRGGGGGGSEVFRFY